MYNLDEELSLCPKNAEALHGSFSHPSCTSLLSCSTQTPFLTAIRLLDPRYVLLPPQHPLSTILQPIEDEIAMHFATCFSQNVHTGLPVFEVGEHHTMGMSSAAGRRGSHVCIGTIHPG
jgi:hypothetical protein